MTEGKPREMTAQALAWLDARPEPAPPEVRQRMAEALAGVMAGTVPGALAEGALACLQATIAAPQQRATALDLLAADALLTYALEAAAEISAAALREMTQAYGPNALASLLPEGEASTRATDQAPEGATASGEAPNADAPTPRRSEAAAREQEAGPDNLPDGGDRLDSPGEGA